MCAIRANRQLNWPTAFAVRKRKQKCIIAFHVRVLADPRARIVASEYVTITCLHNSYRWALVITLIMKNCRSWLLQVRVAVEQLSTLDARKEGEDLVAKNIL